MTLERDVEAGARAKGLSRRQALTYGGAVASGVAAGAVLAGPAEAAASAPGASATAMFSISLVQANRILNSAVRYATDNSLPPMFVIVVDVCGDEKASRRMDGNSAASVTLAPIKARTSVAFRTATATLAERTTDAARIASFTAAGFSLLGGGVPITVDGMVIGAVGVGGGTPEQDAEVAEAGVAALR